MQYICRRAIEIINYLFTNFKNTIVVPVYPHTYTFVCVSSANFKCVSCSLSQISNHICIIAISSGRTTCICVNQISNYDIIDIIITTSIGISWCAVLYSRNIYIHRLACLAIVGISNINCICCSCNRRNPRIQSKFITNCH